MSVCEVRARFAALADGTEGAPVSNGSRPPDSRQEFCPRRRHALFLHPSRGFAAQISRFEYSDLALNRPEVKAEVEVRQQAYHLRMNTGARATITAAPCSSKMTSACRGVRGSDVMAKNATIGSCAAMSS